MRQDMNGLRQRAIEATLAQFNFERLHSVVSQFGWALASSPASPDAVPSISEIKDIARSLLEQAWDDEEAPNCEFCHDGLRASRTNGCLSLQYVLEEAYFVDVVDN